MLINLFRIYMIYRFLNAFFGKSGQSRTKQFLVYGSFFLVNTGMYLLLHMMWINIACNLLGIFWGAALHTKSVKARFFVSSFVCGVMIGCDTMVTLLFIEYEDGMKTSQAYAAVVVFLMLICELLAEKVLHDRKSKEVYCGLPLILVPSASIVLICLLFYTKNITKNGMVLFGVGLLAINFFVFWLYNLLSDTISRQYENEALRFKVQGYASQIDVMLDSEEKVKALRHDMKHHLGELKAMAAKGKDAEMLIYISDMEGFMGNPDEVAASGNVEIDGVLNYMIKRATRELANVEVQVQLPKAVGHSFDINVILGNLLENAIEAAAKTKEKRLGVKVRMKQGILRIEVENSFDGKLRQSPQGLLTTKDESIHHGIGLKNVRKMVEKYDGSMEVHAEGNRFCVSLLLYLLESGEEADKSPAVKAGQL